MIERIPFGRTGHASSRVLFGAAALGGMKQPRADSVLELLLEFGVNHIDTAASYGESELRIAPWMRRQRGDFFLATKTGERRRQEARDGLHRSLERLGVDSVDLIQLHNLVPERDWEVALGPGGALEALVDARAEGLVRFIGVTGHGAAAPRMHLRSLERFAFDSVLAPCSYTMLAQAEYAADFAELLRVCEERGVAVQTIKSVARRRWQEEGGRRFSWYEPLRDRDAIRRAVHFVLARPGLFLNSSSDGTLLRDILEAAAEVGAAPARTALESDASRFSMRPLFGPGLPEGI